MDRSEVAAGNAQLAGRRSERDTITNRKLPIQLAVDVHAVEPRGVVGDGGSVLFLNGEQVVLGLGSDNLRIALFSIPMSLLPRG